MARIKRDIPKQKRGPEAPIRREECFPPVIGTAGSGTPGSSPPRGKPKRTGDSPAGTRLDPESGPVDVGIPFDSSGPR